MAVLTAAIQWHLFGLRLGFSRMDVRCLITVTQDSLRTQNSRRYHHCPRLRGWEFPVYVVTPGTLNRFPEPKSHRDRIRKLRHLQRRTLDADASINVLSRTNINGRPTPGTVFMACSYLRYIATQPTRTMGTPHTRRELCRRWVCLAQTQTHPIDSCSRK